MSQHVGKNYIVDQSFGDVSQGFEAEAIVLLVKCTNLHSPWLFISSTSQFCLMNSEYSWWLFSYDIVKVKEKFLWEINYILFSYVWYCKKKTHKWKWIV
jgi:hypothetical protein